MHEPRQEKVSISALRRQYGMAYGDAARLLARMEAAGAVSEPAVDGNRDVLDPRALEKAAKS